MNQAPENEAPRLKMAMAEAMAEAKEKAYLSLGQYKFQMFGYHAAIWVKLNQISGLKRPNPFAPLVAAARRRGKRRTEVNNGEIH